MRSMIARCIGLGGAILFLPVSAHAAPWCTVPVKEASLQTAPAISRLEPVLNSTPRPMARMHTEGTLPHEGIYDESLEGRRELRLMGDAALAWRAGAGEAYYTMAARYFEAWVATYQPSFNPIDETPLDVFAETYAILAPRLQPAAKGKAQAFLRSWARGYITRIDTHAPVTTPAVNNWNNNWQSHRIKIVTMIAVALNDDELFADARRLYRAQIEANVLPDGRVTDFVVRDALHYVVYDAEPLSRAALAARLKGEDWFNYTAPSGGSLAKVFMWLEPYATGMKTHQEFVRSTIKFDATRAAAGVKGFSGPFDPAKAGDAYWLASMFDARYRPLAKRLRPSPPLSLALCGV